MLTIIHIKDGQITNKAAARKLFQVEDGSYVVELKKNKKRSNPQNAYYWSCIIPLVTDGLKNLGHTWSEEDTHEVLKGLFLKRKKELPNGEIVETVGSTRKLTTEEFNEYIEQIAQFAASYLSLTIPAPGEQTTLNY
jgi:hypothetical protein